jgi:CheY-like chemotaxis protein
MNSPIFRKNRRVLVIDDTPSIHDDFRKILSPLKDTNSALSLTETQLFGNPLKEEGQPRYEVDSANQGLEGVSMIKKARDEGRPYAMAFVDMRMPPGWNGVKTSQEIWKIDYEIQIVICTAYSDYSWHELLELVGNNERIVILKKPFDAVEAILLANDLTDKWRSIHFELKKKLPQTSKKQRTEES